MKRLLVELLGVELLAIELQGIVGNDPYRCMPVFDPQGGIQLQGEVVVGLPQLEAVAPKVGFAHQYRSAVGVPVVKGTGSDIRFHGKGVVAGQQGVLVGDGRRYVVDVRIGRKPVSII